MRVRLPIALAFSIIALGVTYMGFADIQLPQDKAFHFGAFFVLTMLFYWIADLPRRKAILVTILVCTLFAGISSEFAQAYLAQHRTFDTNDIAANIAGSLVAVGLSAFYHRRLLERRRQARYDRLRSNLDSEVEAQIESSDIELNNVAQDVPTSKSPTP